MTPRSSSCRWEPATHCRLLGPHDDHWLPCVIEFLSRFSCFVPVPSLQDWPCRMEGWMKAACRTMWYSPSACHPRLLFLLFFPNANPNSWPARASKRAAPHFLPSAFAEYADQTVELKRGYISLGNAGGRPVLYFLFIFPPSLLPISSFHLPSLPCTAAPPNGTSTPSSWMTYVPARMDPSCAVARLPGIRAPYRRIEVGKYLIWRRCRGASSSLFNSFAFPPPCALRRTRPYLTFSYSLRPKAHFFSTSRGFLCPERRHIFAYLFVTHKALRDCTGSSSFR
ncbi:hypothetical protein MVEN_00133200 [Mycena venus]|uniref:Uncharacterized protein n=1 Tax=Mycena venus TaxID=2733690 RepID=A0A8H6Z5H0_9AGAR|nr:hypothetical protein MVEN_00133200 [Mycena venus]